MHTFWVVGSDPIEDEYGKKVVPSRSASRSGLATPRMARGEGESSWMFKEVIIN